MSVAREAVFECTYASPAEVRTGYVRAWDAEEAVQLFAEELRVDGVDEPGDISVRARKDGPARESVYAPE